jgi:hypothetical protein
MMTVDLSIGSGIAPKLSVSSSANRCPQRVLEIRQSDVKIYQGCQERCQPLRHSKLRWLHKVREADLLQRLLLIFDWLALLPHWPEATSSTSTGKLPVAKICLVHLDVFIRSQQDCQRWHTRQRSSGGATGRVSRTIAVRKQS